MQHRILSKTGVLRQQHCILHDLDGLWHKYACDKAAEDAGYVVHHVSDEMVLRRIYECDYISAPEQPRIIVFDTPAVYIPMDIDAKFISIELSFRSVFPRLNADALCRLPGTDFDHLASIVDDATIAPLDRAKTEALCTTGLKSGRFAEAYGNKMLDEAVAAAQSATTHRDWTFPAVAFGKASMIHHGGTELDGFAEKQACIEQACVQWIESKYNSLSGAVDKNRPVLLSKVNDFIRKSSAKRALIVMDGMSFENFHTIRRTLTAEEFSYEVQSTFSFFPTVTGVARQSIFSGKLPIEHAKPFSLENEEKQWFDYWRNAGLRNEEIAFFKSEEPEIPRQAKAVGIVINICDDLMHDELQGLSGLQQGIETWMKNGRLVALIKNLLKNGFAVYMTADHGNTSATAQGRFMKPGLLAEPASRRAVIYQSFADAIELAKFTTVRYSGSYLPKEATAYLFEPGTCYGDKGKEYITHGGMTLEEAVVPFIRIGEYNG